MAHQIAAIRMTLSDLQDHSVTFKVIQLLQVFSCVIFVLKLCGSCQDFN